MGYSGVPAGGDSSGGRLRLYAAENDHDAVGRLALRKEVTGLRLRCIPLLVDRVCTDREIKPTEVRLAFHRSDHSSRFRPSREVTIARREHYSMTAGASGGTGVLHHGGVGW
jgi:hypothetical protein